MVIGITDYAQDQLGDIVFVELPAVARVLAQGETFGVVESIKAVSDLYAPLTGEVLAVNEALERAPELANSDPYGEGWFVRLRLAGPAESGALLDVAAYRALHPDAGGA